MYLANTQDKDLLSDLLNMANGNNPENDSILGFEVESDSEEETILMSQRLDTESWPSLEQGTSCSSPPLFEQNWEIPQSDGANDDEDFPKFGNIFLSTFHFGLYVKVNLVNDIFYI